MCFQRYTSRAAAIQRRRNIVSKNTFGSARSLHANTATAIAAAANRYLLIAIKQHTQLSVVKRSGENAERGNGAICIQSLIYHAAIVTGNAKMQMIVKMVKNFGTTILFWT